MYDSEKNHFNYFYNRSISILILAVIICSPDIAVILLMLTDNYYTFLFYFIKFSKFVTAIQTRKWATQSMINNATVMRTIFSAFTSILIVRSNNFPSLNKNASPFQLCTNRIHTYLNKNHTTEKESSYHAQHLNTPATGKIVANLT